MARAKTNAKAMMEAMVMMVVMVMAMVRMMCLQKQSKEEQIRLWQVFKQVQAVRAKTVASIGIRRGKKKKEFSGGRGLFIYPAGTLTRGQIEFGPKLFRDLANFGHELRPSFGGEGPK